MARTSETGILLYAQGDAFSDGSFDLRSFELVITNYRMIVDHLLPLAIGQKTLTDRVKNDVKYKVEVNEGSVEIILNFILENHELLIAAAVSDGGNQLASVISKLINGVVDLRRALTTILQAGLKPTIHIDQSIHLDKSVTYDIKTGNINLTNPQFIIGADSTKSALDRLINGIDGSNISEIDLNHQKLRTKLTTKDREITGSQKEELATQIEVVGRLDMAAITSHRAHIITGNSRYPVTWDESLRPKIKQFFDTEGIVFKVRPVIDHRQFKDEPIGFHVLDCWSPQTQMHV
ncbi:hypothetical protein MPL1_09180 [Methylophaga lonarensis MPL]|uniref:Uncharacterized protein n=1 Tax=Methylophaga lonarensis MPL TaxID=1286106 RepID=M7PFF7_9GAMM|nr:hypothetical protein [Methylophaga lonarensis]EMR12640.1 hypothetical protein MPL1_09180 [Methylophaga lonarensis MPL]